MDERSNTKRHAAHARYDRDLYGWATEQAALLRAGRLTEADAANIAEELDDVGNEQYDKLESALRLILLHLLKWDHQAERRSRSWWATITVQRNQVRRVLRKNPGLKPQVKTATAAVSLLQNNGYTRTTMRLGIDDAGVTHDQAAVRQTRQKPREQLGVIRPGFEGVGAREGRIDRDTQLFCPVPKAEAENIKHQRLVIAQPPAASRPSALPDPGLGHALGDDRQKRVAHLRK